MRALRALLVLLAALLMLAVLALWLVPRFMDWNSYRDEIARLAATALDRPVLIDGPITLSVLPQPTLTASDIRIAGGPDEGTFAARELSLTVALGPLLSGRIDARDLALRGADLHIPWPLPDDTLPVRAPGWLAGLSASIEDGRVSIGGVEFTTVAATLTIGGPIGGYQIAGTARLYDRPWRFAAHLSGAGADLVAGLDMTVDGLGPIEGTEAMFSGQIGPEGAGGRFSAHGPDLAQLLPAPKVPFSAEGRLTVATGLAAADDLALQIGGAPAHGAVALRVAPSLRVDLALAASRLDLDAWIPVLLRGDVFSYPVGLDLSAEAAQFSGGLIRRLRAAFELTPAEVQVRDASAILPGDASLRLSGRLTRADAQHPHFVGKVALSDPDLRGTLNWLDLPGLKPLLALPPAVLRSADLSGEAVVDPGRLALTDLGGTLDGSRVSGDLTLAPGRPEEAKPMAVRADATLDRLDLDPWLPSGIPSSRGLPGLVAPLDADLKLRAAQARFHGLAIGGLVLDAATAGGRLALRRLEGRAEGVQASLSGAIDAEGRVTQGRLDLTTGDATPLAALLPASWRATPAFWAVSCKAAIRADGPPDALDLGLDLALGDARLRAHSALDLPAGHGSGTISLDHPDAAWLLQAAGFDLRSWIGEGPLAAEARLAGTPGRIEAERFALSGGMLRGGGGLTLDRTGAQPRLTGRVVADTLPLPPLDPRAPNPLPWAALLGWQAEVGVEAGEVLAGPSGKATPVLRQVSANATLAEGTLRLNEVAARLAGGIGGARESNTPTLAGLASARAAPGPAKGTLSGSASLDAASAPPAFALDAALADAAIAGPVTGLPLDITAGHADGTLKLTASGHSPAAMLATLGGEIRASIRDGTLAGFDLGAVKAALGSSAPASGLDAALKSALEGGGTAFDRLQVAASAARGNLVIGDALLKAPSGGVVLSGSLDLPDSALDLHFVLHPAVPNAPEIGLRLTGPLAAPRHLPELADVTRWQAQHAAGQ